MVRTKAIILMVLNVHVNEQGVSGGEISYFWATEVLESPPGRRTYLVGFGLIILSSSIQTVCEHLSSGHNHCCASHSDHLH